LLTFQETFQRFKQQGWVNNLEFELICKDGSLLPISLNATAIYDAAGDFLMSRSILFDIRDRKHIEAALRDSEAKFRSLSESSPNGVLMTDAQGHFIYTNPRAQEICGYSFEEALGTGWTGFIHPDDLLPLLAHWESAIVHPQNLMFNQVRHVHQDGTVRYGRIKLAPLQDATSQFTGYVGTIEDITEQRQIETMKNEFISVVSHELRTPLTAIRGSLGLLANGVYDRKPEKGKKMLVLALDQTDRLVRLVSDILDLKRLESGQVALTKQSCEAATLMIQSAEMMQDLAQQNCITLSVTPLYVPVWAAPDAIAQTLTNLISNAIKFSPEGSTIWLSAELVEDEAGRQGVAEPIRSSSQVCFAIKDQGRGIPADKLETIFGQFQQVDASDSRQKGGTGLGLAICRSIVQQHGGQIWVESTLGKGSTFYFTLPTSPQSEVSSEKLTKQ
jgi:PAS domain S-box-containing protein